MALSTVAKVGIGWIACVTTTLFAFALSKKYIDGRRYESMKSRERMRKANFIDEEKEY